MFRIYCVTIYTMIQSKETFVLLLYTEYGDIQCTYLRRPLFLLHRKRFKRSRGQNLYFFYLIVYQEVTVNKAYRYRDVGIS